MDRLLSVSIYVLCIVSALGVTRNDTLSSNDVSRDELPATTDSFERCFNETRSFNDEDLAVGPQEYSRTLIRGSHKFSLELLRFLSNFESKDSSEGLLVSPFSVWSALVATYMGSRGDTEKEIKQVLQIENIPKHAVGMSYQGLRFWYELKKNATEQKNKKFSYAAANRIFVNSKIDLNKCMKEHFADEVESLDFSDAKKATNTINTWVSDITKGKIKELISGGGLNPWTQVVIANGVYFQSQWLFKFDSAKTEKMTFQVTPSESIETEFMSQTSNFMFGVSEKLKATVMDLPYANQHFSMLVILPENSRGVDGLIKMIRPNDIYDILNDMYEDEIHISIPKFKMDQEFDLAGPLYSMGVKKLFDPRFADLTGFFDEASIAAQKGVTINSVIHKASITVNEEGTEAAAATAFLMARSGRPAFPTRFIVDRPFLFIIRDTATNVILFVGAVRRPNYAA